MADELAVAMEAAKAAGEVAMRYFRRGVPVETKADGSFVTQADRSCERTIRQVIQQRFPDDAFLGEEYGETATGARRRWIIDPIDGTNNYVRGIPFFATLIALEEGDDIAVGVAFAPATGDLLTARRGGGAYMNGQPAKVSRVAHLAEASVGFGELKLFEHRGWWDRFPELVRRAWRTRGFGDYLGHAQVIQGQAEIMLDTGA
ncbi:MAG: histidinol phosphate phosphatase, partial [Deinococcus sp.]|nr:histidinol phosphate phosphatase [Deinococcus sp.]